MSIKRFLRILLWLVPLAAVAAWLVAEGAISEQAELQRAFTSLVFGETERAHAEFERFQDSLWYGREARFGLALCAAIDGEEDEFDAGDIPESMPVSLSLLMARELRSGDFAACRRLAGMAEVAGEKTAPLYLAASSLELGDREAATASWALVSKAMRATLTGRRYAQAAGLLERGAVSIVRDRRGELVGQLDGSGAFLFAEGVEPDLVPATIIDELTEWETPAGVRLGIDLQLSELALDAIEGYRGSIVLLDPRRGEVLAAVSDERTKRRGGTPALEQRLEPASILKVITTVAAMRAGLDPDAEIAEMTCNGAIRYRGGILYCPYTAGPLRSLNRAMAISCNIAFAELGVKVGWEGMLAELRNWGFDSEAGNPFPLGSIITESGSELQLANLSIGLNTAEITTAHAALIAATFANGGVMPAPEVLHGGDGFLGLSPHLKKIETGRKLVEEAWLPPIVESMRAVALWGGTAAWIAPPRFPVAMKTGTGGGSRQGFHINYIGFGPMPRADIVFSVRVTNQLTSPRARKAGFEVTRRLLYALNAVAMEYGWR